VWLLSSKWEEYRRTLRQISVPSLPILLFQISSLLALEAHTFKRPALAWVSVAVCSVAIISSSAIVTGPCYVAGKTKIKRGRTRLHIALFLGICCAISAAPFIKTALHSPATAFTHTAENNYRVVSVQEKRYQDELLVEYRHAKQKIRGMIIYRGRMRAEPGDIILISEKIHHLKKMDEISPYRRSLARRGISFIVYADAGKLTLKHRGPSSFRMLIRNTISDRCGILFSPESSALAQALVLGNREQVPKKIISLFKEAGVLHVLAASGLHVGILASVPLILLGIFRVNRKTMVLLTLPVLCAYLYLTDMPVSLKRACMMYAIFALQYLFSLHKNIINTLFLTAVVILTLWPEELFSLGFQLSFGATLGIILLHERYKKSLSVLPVHDYLRSGLAVTLAAQVFAIPLILVWLKEITAISILSNIVIIPLITAQFILFLASLTIYPCLPQVSFLIAWFADSIYRILETAVSFFASLNGRAVMESTDPLIVFAYFLLLVPLLPVPWKKAGLLCIIAAHLAFIGAIRHNTCPAQEIRQFTGKKSFLTLARDKKRLALTGHLGDRETAARVIHDIEKTRYSSLLISMKKSNRENLRFFSEIIKKCRVKECIIESGFQLSGYMKEFCRLAQIDGVAIILKGPTANSIKSGGDSGRRLMEKALDCYDRNIAEMKNNHH